ncbi:CoA ester lyase [Microvirga sp. W0021]|uniref:CoA ester lyase n=1 Tax=Hohaiivirga grylli TaxID=3133970 RepID=A0ABV0BEW3_9HYPH
MRSFLFVPGDSLHKFTKARSGHADALILDLEDAVALDNKEAARKIVCEMLQTERNDQKLFVRVNALETEMTFADLAAVMPLKPDGIVLPKADGADSIARLSYYLEPLEMAHNIPVGETKVIAIATESASAIFGLESYRRADKRLWGLMWGAEDLAASLGATTNNIDGIHTEPFRLARNLCLMAAAAAEVVAIDTICPVIKDLSVVTAEAVAARRDGFAAKAVIHPSHIDVVNDTFTPAPEEIEWAEMVLAAFAANPQAGVVTVNGRMIDKPHERAARKIIDMMKQNRS